MATQGEIEQVLEGHSPQVRALVEELRRSIFRGMPIAQERVDPGNRALVYGLDSLGANLCTIATGEDSVEVRFPAGARLFDPDKLLEGSDGEARTITVGRQGSIPSEAFEHLVAQAFVMNAG